MDSYDKIEELLLAEGYSKEEIPSIMVSLVEQGINPTQIFASGLGNMLFNKTKTQVKPKFTTTQQVGGPLGQTNVKSIRDLGGSVAPDGWGGFGKQPTPAVKQPLRPGGQTPGPNFKVNNTPTPRTPVPSVSTTPKPPTPKPNLFTRLKGLATPQNLVRGLRGLAGGALTTGAQTLGLELATKLAQSAGRPGQSRMSKFGANFGDAPVYNTPLSPNNVDNAKASGYVPNRGISGIRDKIEKSTPIRPPASTPPASTPPASTLPASTPPASTTPASRPVVKQKQTGNNEVDLATWRRANPRLAKVNQLRKSGASRELVNKVLYKRDMQSSPQTRPPMRDEPLF